MNIKWGKKKYDKVEVDLTEPPAVFKSQLFSLTGEQSFLLCEAIPISKVLPFSVVFPDGMKLKIIFPFHSYTPPSSPFNNDLHKDYKLKDYIAAPPPPPPPPRGATREAEADDRRANNRR